MAGPELRHSPLEAANGTCRAGTDGAWVDVTDAIWQRLLDIRSGKAVPSGGMLSPGEARALALYGPLAVCDGDDLVVAQIGQSLDGRVATEEGDAQGISGADGLAHLHRLRALADAVVIGVKTALHDDPQLTVRLAEGDSPAKVVIDPDGRLPNSARLLHDTSTRRIVIQTVPKPRPEGVETIILPRRSWICPKVILKSLRELGLTRILVEGGGITITQFLEAGLLDRLHVAIAPLLIGSGPQSLTTSPVGTLAQALRPETAVFNLGSDMLFDCVMQVPAGASD